MNKKVTSNIKLSIVSLILLCGILAASLIIVLTSYTQDINDLKSQVEEKDHVISSLTSEVANKTSQLELAQEQNQQLRTWLKSNITAFTSQVENLQSELDEAKLQISNLQSELETATAQIATLQVQVNKLTALANDNVTEKPTLVFHVCEKGEGYEWGHLPDANYTYNQLLNLTQSGYSVLLNPEYKGHENWTEELNWIKENFGGSTGLSLVLDVFCGGLKDYPTPMLVPEQIEAAIAVANIKWLKFAEVISWHIEHNRTFPTDYVTSILNFCRTHGLKLFWTEWKTGDNTFQQLQTCIAGFEDIVTVAFSTNSGDLEPDAGFTYVKDRFRHWGASVQAWYWTTRNNADPLSMPLSLLIQHTLSAKTTGAEIIQFEPYWYFFDNGYAKESTTILATILEYAG
ncbi:MAG: hypothetical protein QXU99_01255 [Candidatus Bathyarchaeia archaeon]